MIHHGEQKKLTHFDNAGKARMIDVARKEETNRLALATGDVFLSPQAYEKVKSGTIAKGDVLGIARIAGIMAAKKVDMLIPLTHPLPISKAAVNFELDDENHAVLVTAEVGITGKTGVEMEALTAVSVAALTIYDMCKSIDKSISISNIRLLKKSGGKSGTYLREENGQ